MTETISKPKLPRKASRLTTRSRQVPSSITEWHMGDSVEVLPEREKAIVYQPADDHGDVIVQVKGIKKVVKHTRLKLLIPAHELYPDNYDFSIIFDSVENRKARHVLSKRYDENATIIYENISKNN